ncbi:MAG: acyl-CoA dehydrogenase, partial [Deltaproteobacteria bacterium]|nr:acyl-CoA dehydrogenase [Deltaproteobacteria bacterium]
LKIRSVQMEYNVNYRDIQFNLFEYLNIQSLGETEKYQGFGRDEYDAILSEGLKFAQKEIAPLNKKSDEIGCIHENDTVKAPPGFKEAYKNFAANGFLAMDVPTTYGGQNLPMVLTEACGEFFTGSSVAFAMYPGLTRGAAHLIEVFATEELAKTYVPKMYSGEWGGTMCLTEPQAGSAVGDITTSAVKEGDHYKIKGNKIFISSGDHDMTDNIVHLVLARVEGDAPGTKGISLFVVPKFRVNADGSLGESNDVKCVNIEHKMGIKGSATCSLSFGDNDTCIGYLVGEQSKGMRMMFQLMNEARLGVGLQGQATAGAAYEAALRYAKERVQGGGKLIIEYPDVRRMLITQKAYVEGMRALLLYSAYQEDLAKTQKDEAAAQKAQNRIDLLVPICKAYCSDMGFKVTELAIQTHGGYGYCSEYPVEQLMRDVKIASIYEGTNAIQSLDLIARKLGLNQGQLFRELYEDLSGFCAKQAEHPALKEEVASLKKANDDLGMITMKLGEWAMTKNFDQPQLHSISYLYNMGDVVLAWLLTDQAVLALSKLEAIWQAKGATEEEAKSKICEEDEEAKFYESKVKVARFFVSNILPQTKARSKALLSGDESALKIRF